MRSQPNKFLFVIFIFFSPWLKCFPEIYLRGLVYTFIHLSDQLLRSQVSIRGCPWGLSILAGNLQDGCTNTEIQGIIIFTLFKTLHLVKIYSYSVCHTLQYLWIIQNSERGGGVVCPIPLLHLSYLSKILSCVISLVLNLFSY